MSKLPLGECPSCKHPLWDNDADFKGHTLDQVNTVCIYCGTAMRYDLLAGKYVALDIQALPEADRQDIYRAQIMQLLLGPDRLMGDELRRRNKAKKTS